MNAIILIAQLLVLTPEQTGGYRYVPEPTPAGVRALAEAGESPLVVSTEIGDERPALTNYAASAAAVAFEVVPRPHLLTSWRTLGVKVLKTVRYEREGTPERFRREAGLGAFLEGADGLWIPNAKDLPEAWKAALGEAARDRAVCDRLAELRAKIEAQPRRGLLWIESRRVGHFLGWLDFEDENVDAVRLELVGWAKRLEQLLGEKPADLPTTVAPKIACPDTGFRPCADLDAKPPQVRLAPKGPAADLGEGLSFSFDASGFVLSFAITNAADRARWEKSGRTLDFRLYVDNPRRANDILPYRYHCDFAPDFAGTREVWEGRAGWAFSADRRFRPASFGFGASFERLTARPRLREYGPDYPELVPRMEFGADKKTGVWRVRLAFSWQALRGFWPGETEGSTDVWFVALERSPLTGRPVVRRLVWPRANPALHKVRLLAQSPGATAKAYADQLSFAGRWRVSALNRNYPFPATKTPCFHRGDFESDDLFVRRVIDPLTEERERIAAVFCAPKGEKPKYDSLSEMARLEAWEKVPELLSLRRTIGERRAAYLADRYLGKLPPEPKRKAASGGTAPTKAPDADLDADDLQLDDKEEF